MSQQQDQQLAVLRRLLHHLGRPLLHPPGAALRPQGFFESAQQALALQALLCDTHLRDSRHYYYYHGGQGAAGLGPERRALLDRARDECEPLRPILRQAFAPYDAALNQLMGEALLW